jgi:hypothetical protein
MNSYTSELAMQMGVALSQFTIGARKNLPATELLPFNSYNMNTTIDNILVNNRKNQIGQSRSNSYQCRLRRI